MKLNYQKQLLLTIVIALVFNVMNTVFQHWIFSTIGRCLCGLLWIIHPVMWGNEPPTEKKLRLVRLAGVVLILYGLFTRSYFY